MNWINPQQKPSFQFKCGYCGNVVASSEGYGISGYPSIGIYICPHCSKPTFNGFNEVVPDVAPGNEVGHLPDDVASLYLESRNCVAAGCYTASVLTCRKLLAHIGVAQGAATGLSFIKYVEHLADNGFVPPNGKGWVDHIRKKGNEANHEIVEMDRKDAEELIMFIEMLLKFIYEFPNSIAPPPL